jgi:phenylpyruvate tautomerase PptA (4-oxalocrotonate tautomerase family)
MMFIEVFVPKGALDPHQRRRLGERLITEFMTEDEERRVPPALIELGRLTEQVVVHEVETWVVGGRAVDPDEPPRYVVRVSVPSGWLTEMSEEVIARVTRVLAGGEPESDRVYDEPVAWVHVQGIADGSLGVFGQVMRSALLRPTG